MGCVVKKMWIVVKFGLCASQWTPVKDVQKDENIQIEIKTERC